MTTRRAVLTSALTTGLALVAGPAAATTTAPRRHPAVPEVHGTPFPFAGQLRDYLATRPGDVSIGVRLPGTGRSWTHTRGSARNVTASIVKVHIMAAVMLQAQDEGRPLNRWERSRMAPMLRESDNDAATELFEHVGAAAGLDRAGRRLGMVDTRADDAWGLTSTTAADQAALVEHFAHPSLRLTRANRSWGVHQMRNVAADQQWGVGAGPPQGTVALKNGWLSRPDGWHVNSIGWQKTGDADYTIAVLTQDDPGTMEEQVETIEGVSRIVWRNRERLLPPPPSTTGPPREDDDAAEPTTKVLP